MAANCVGAPGTSGQCGGLMPVIRESEGRDLVHDSQSAQCGTKTVGIPQYELTVTNEEQPQPEPPTPPTPPVVIPLPGQATSPSPGDESATGNYPFGLVLSWANGGGATSYVVWLDGVFQGVTTTPSFSPALLAVSTTYSWRVDSLNDGGITIGDLWTFTTAGQVYPPTPPLPAVNISPADGDLAVDPAAVTLSWADGGGAISYDVYLNGVFQVNQSGTSFLAGALAATTSYTWRIDSVNAQGTTLGTVWAFTTTSGLPPVPSKAINPVPADTAVDVDPSTTLFGWDDGGGATSYDVYVNGVFQLNQVATIFDPGILTAFASYTWRIDSVNAGGTTTGDTWTFDTAGHATVVDWASRVVTNGGAAPSTPTKQALSTFCDALDAAGLTAKMIAVNCMVPDNLIAATTPLIVGPGSDPWANTGFTGGMLSTAGLLAQTNTEYLNTGVNASTAFPSDNTAGYSLYCQCTNASYKFNGGMLCYALYRQCGIWGLSGTHVSLSATSAHWNISGAQAAIAGGEASFASASRTDALAVAVYQANSNVGFNTLGTANSAANVRPNVPLGVNTRLGAALFPNAPNYYSFAAIHLGLTAGETEDLYDAVQAMRVSLGGGYA